MSLKEFLNLAFLLLNYLVMEFFLGCYKSYPLKENLVPRFRKIREQLRDFFLKFVLSFPGSLIL
jgi:hypothetical protein